MLRRGTCPPILGPDGAHLPVQAFREYSIKPEDLLYEIEELLAP